MNTGMVISVGINSALVLATLGLWQSAAKSLNLAQDSRRPHLALYFDTRKVGGIPLLWLKLRNFGDTIAYDVTVEWDVPLYRNAGSNKPEGSVDFGLIPMLIPKGEGISNDIFIDHCENAFARLRGTNIKGRIRFRDVNNKQYEDPFVLGLDHCEFYSSPSDFR